MRTNRIGALAIVAVLGVSACGGGETSPEVALEARWQCDVQRQTFADLGARDAELATRLTAAGLTRADYDTFKERLSDSADLRIEVADEYEAYCLP